MPPRAKSARSFSQSAPTGKASRGRIPPLPQGPHRLGPQMASRRDSQPTAAAREATVWLFHWLWRHKDRVSHWACPPFPETVAYDYHSPRAWFSYKPPSGSPEACPEVIKKPLHDVHHRAILDAFLGPDTAVDVVAEWRWRDEASGVLQAQVLDRQGGGEGTERGKGGGGWGG